MDDDKKEAWFDNRGDHDATLNDVTERLRECFTRHERDLALSHGLRRELVKILESAGWVPNLEHPMHKQLDAFLTIGVKRSS